MKFLLFWRLPIQLVAFALLSSGLFAQAPNGYYSNAEGKTGAALKTALYNIIKGHTDLGYGGLYTTYQTSDNIVINGQNKVYDMYSIRADGTANYYYEHFENQCGTYSSEGDCYNREHSMPQSWFNERAPMKNDAHHVIPSDGKVNGMRSNYPHAEVGSASFTSTNGSKLGSCSTTGYSGTVFEPIDEYKGDFARMYMYMATRYEDQIGSWSGNGTANTVLAGNAYPVYKAWYIALLLKWHQQDPVSTKELERNEAIYDRQRNRNPFIDNPDYAEMIWGTTPANPLSFTSTAITSATVGTTYTYNIVAQSTTSGATLTITAPTKPSWLSLTTTGNGRATLSGTPTATGSHQVVLQVSDGTNTKQQAFTITVEEAEITVNFTSTPITSATVASLYSYSITTSSSTATAATITATVKPEWLTLTSTGNGTATLSGTPTADNIGQNSVRINASNGTHNVEQVFTIAVEDTTVLGGGQMFTETFENMPASSNSYSNRTWTGDNNFEWTATNARTDQTIDNRAICLKDSGTPYVESETLTGGCSMVKLQHQQAFPGSGGIITVYVNSSPIGTADVTTDVQVDSFAVSVTGDFVIKVESNGEARVKIDNLCWRQKGSAPQNQKPVISGVTANPAAPLVNQAITISATITDADGTVTSAQLKWGTSQDALNNTLSMTATGPVYSATIPAQVAAGTIYYRILATDNLDETSVLNNSIEISALSSPTITNVTHTPQEPNQNQSVTVTAIVTDSDVSIDAVNLLWGLSQSNMNNSVAMTATGDSYSATIPAQAANSTVFYKVQATNSNNVSATSDVYQYTVILYDDVDSDALTKVKVYPNPAHTFVVVEAATNIQSIEVINTLGRTLYHSNPGAQQEQIDLSGMMHGVYIIRVRVNDTISTTRIIKC